MVLPQNILSFYSCQDSDTADLLFHGPDNFEKELEFDFSRKWVNAGGGLPVFSKFSNFPTEWISERLSDLLPTDTPLKFWIPKNTFLFQKENKGK